MRQFLTPRDQKASTAQARTERKREREGGWERESGTAGEGKEPKTAALRGEKKLAHSCKHYAMKFIWIGVGSKFKYFSDNNNNNNEVN